MFLIFKTRNLRAPSVLFSGRSLWCYLMPRARLLWPRPWATDGLGPMDRFHFNASWIWIFWEAWLFLLGGFGWLCWIQIDSSNRTPVLYRIIARSQRSSAEFLLAGIGASFRASVTSFMVRQPDLGRGGGERYSRGNIIHFDSCCWRWGRSGCNCCRNPLQR